MEAKRRKLQQLNSSSRRLHGPPDVQDALQQQQPPCSTGPGLALGGGFNRDPEQLLGIESHAYRPGAHNAAAPLPLPSPLPLHHSAASLQLPPSTQQSISGCAQWDAQAQTTPAAWAHGEGRAVEDLEEGPSVYDAGDVLLGVQLLVSQFPHALAPRGCPAVVLATQLKAVLKGDSGLDVDKELVALQQQRSVQLFRLPTQHRDAAAVPYQEYYSALQRTQQQELTATNSASAHAVTLLMGLISRNALPLDLPEARLKDALLRESADPTPAVRDALSDSLPAGARGQPSIGTCVGDTGGSSRPLDSAGSARIGQGGVGQLKGVRAQRLHARSTAVAEFVHQGDAEYTQRQRMGTSAPEVVRPAPARAAINPLGPPPVPGPLSAGALAGLMQDARRAPYRGAAGASSSAQEPGTSGAKAAAPASAIWQYVTHLTGDNDDAAPHGRAPPGSAQRSPGTSASPASRPTRGTLRDGEQAGLRGNDVQVDAAADAAALAAGRECVRAVLAMRLVGGADVDRCVSALMQLGLIVRESGEHSVFLLAIPKIAAILGARQDLRVSLKRRPFREAIEKTLVASKLKSSKLGWNFHLKDALGLGIITAFVRGNNTVYKLRDDA